MATKQKKWRTNAISGYVEGTTLLYVDSRSGSSKGNGTRQRPFKTIAQAKAATGSSATWVVLRGVFTEHLVGKYSGNTYLMNLRADYYGAAIYDGKGENMLLWFCAYTNMIMINCGNSLEAQDISISVAGAYDFNNKRAPLVGVGRAHYAGNAYHAGDVYGFASSPVLCHNSKLWRGGAGTTSGSNIIWSHPVRNANNCGVKLFGTNTQSTFRDCKAFVNDWQAGARERRSLYGTLTTTSTNTSCLFSNFDIYVDEGSKDTFTSCFFDKDCKFYFRDQLNGGVEEYIVLTDKSGEITISPDVDNHKCVVTGCASIAAAINALRTNGNITQASSVAPVFSGCKFSETEGEAEIFNNVDALDFTLKDGCEATTATHDFYGALPPCRSIGVIYDVNNPFASDGHIDCWDNRTKNGCVTIADGAICVEDSSPVNSGLIYSKILASNPLFSQYSALYSMFADQVLERGFVLNRQTCFGDEFHADDEITEGTYIVKGAPVTYDNVLYAVGDVIEVHADIAGQQFTSDSDDSYLLQYSDPNIMNVVYCRCRSHVYSSVTLAEIKTFASPKWKTGVVYYNNGGKEMTYNGRPIAIGESFVIDNPSVAPSVVGGGDDYSIAIMFDDRELSNPSDRLVPATEWIPAQMWGKYFVGKNNGAITHDTDGVAISSGNHNAWDDSGQPVCGGYYSILNQPYVQFAIFVNKI